VSLPKLIHKLSCFGFNGLLLSWLSNFLLDRRISVKISDCLSSQADQISGIPQGSSLGPLCFSLYINDLPSTIIHSKLKLFADDVKLYLAYSPNDNNAHKNFQFDLNSLSHWANLWQLNISIPKSFILHIGKSNQKHSYYVNNKLVATTDNVKDLGILITSDLSWHAQCTYVCKKANFIANTIVRAFKCRDVSMYMSAFNIYVLPILDYCSFVWNPTLVSDICMLERVQKCFTRRVFRKCNLPKMSYNNRLLLLNSSSLEHKRLISTLSMFHSIINKFVTCNLSDISLAVTTHLRGNQQKLYVNRCRLNIRKPFFTNRCIPIWNSLPDVAIRSNTISAFKARLCNCNLSYFMHVGTH
jgi:hypothetical protein